MFRRSGTLRCKAAIVWGGIPPVFVHYKQWGWSKRIQEKKTTRRRVEALTPQEDRPIKKRIILRRCGYGATEKVRKHALTAAGYWLFWPEKSIELGQLCLTWYRKTRIQQRSSNVWHLFGKYDRRYTTLYWVLWALVTKVKFCQRTKTSD